MKKLEELTKEELEIKLKEVQKRTPDCTRKRVEEKIKLLLKHPSSI